MILTVDLSPYEAAIRHQVATHEDDPQDPVAFVEAVVHRLCAGWEKQLRQEQRAEADAVLAELAPDELRALIERVRREKGRP